MEKRISIYQNVRNDRQYKASTGLSQAEFEKLSKKFAEFYPENTYSMPENFGNPPTFQDSAEALFFLLFYKKNYPSFQVLGISFGISDKTAHYYVNRLKPILYQTLEAEEVLPKRFFKDATEMNQFFAKEEDLVIDATEIPSQRPDNEDIQEEKYSKKKAVYP